MQPRTIHGHEHYLIDVDTAPGPSNGLPSCAPERVQLGGYRRVMSGSRTIQFSALSVPRRPPPIP